ncbi:flippase [Pseudoflavitalea rhizosphaerae]|uniref:flippase n=1 Tax=Pseudoflavitalea rhizosphaerae TaxID=1884793 RepID=UPI0013DFFD7B|nr:flippase [Pseudoflavitalea rhizosphaerae]
MLSIRKNLAYNFLLSASQVLLPLVSIPYVSRVLSPEGIGRVSFIDSFTYYFLFIAEYGIILYGIREVAKKKHDKAARDVLVSELLALHLITSLIAVVLYSIAVFVLWDKIGDVRLLLFSVSYLLINSFACEWYFMGMERFRYITLRSLITRLLALASLFILVKGGEDYWIYYGIMVVAAIVNSLWNNLNLFREVKLSFRNIDWKKHLKYTHITNGINLAMGVTLLLDNVLLRLVSTAAVVGIYALSAKILRMATLLITDSLQVFYPRIAALRGEGNEDRKQEIMQKNLQFLVFFAVPMSAGICLLAGPLVRLLFGDEYTEAIPVIRILSFFPLLRGLSLFFCNQVLIAHQQEKKAFISLAIGNLLYIPVMLLLSWQWQYRGAAVSLIIAETLVLLIAYSLSSRSFPSLQLFDRKSFFHPVLSASIFIPVFYFLYELQLPDLVVIFTGIPVCIIFYFIMQLFVLRNEFARAILDIVIQGVGSRSPPGE